MAENKVKMNQITCILLEPLTKLDLAQSTGNPKTILSESSTSLVYINQKKNKIGRMSK